MDPVRPGILKGQAVNEAWVIFWCGMAVSIALTEF